MKNVNIIYYSKNGNTKLLARRIMDIFRSLFPKDVNIEILDIESTSIDEIKNSSGFIFGSPDYFNYIAGKVKTVFDELYDIRAELKGRPAFGFITHGGGGKAAKYLEKLMVSIKLEIIGPIISVEEKEISSKDESLIRKNCQNMIKNLK